MKKRYGRAGQGSRECFWCLAVMILLAVLPISFSFAESGGCEVSGNIHEILSGTCKYINNSRHEYICSGCGEQVIADHVLQDFTDEFRCEDEQTHSYICGACGGRIYAPHQYFNGDFCEYCGYKKGSSASTSSTASSAGSGSGSGTASTGTSTGSGSGSGSGTGFVLPTKPDDNAFTASYQKGGEEKTVQVQILGLCRSYIFLDDKPMFVNTEDLEIAKDVPWEQKVAYTCVSGHARLYTDPEMQGWLALLEPGTIVPVLDVADDYIQAQYQGKTGYMKRSSVKLSPPREGIGTGLVDNGKQMVNIRLETSTKSAKVTTVRSGTEMTIIADKDNWYEVEYNQLHGYIRKEFMRIKERGFGEEPEETAEEPEETTEPAQEPEDEPEEEPEPDRKSEEGQGSAQDSEEIAALLASMDKTASAKQVETGSTAGESSENSTEATEETSLIFMDDHVILILVDASTENDIVQTKIRAVATDCVCYLFAFTSEDIINGNRVFYITRRYVDTMNGRLWDAVDSEFADLDYRWTANLTYDMPFISEYAESMKYNYATIGCTLADRRISQPIGFTVIEARQELDMDALLEGRITMDSVREDLIRAFQLYISTP